VLAISQLAGGVRTPAAGSVLTVRYWLPSSPAGPSA
jgi:hypothetical protein